MTLFAKSAQSAVDILFHSILVLLKNKKIPVQPVNEHRVKGYTGGLNIQRKTRIFFKDNLELALIIMHGLIGLLGTSLNHIPISWLGKALRIIRRSRLAIPQA